MSRLTTSTPPSDIASVQARMNAYLLRYCQAEVQRAREIHANYARLWEAITDHIVAGGKRLRPYLVVAAYEALGGADADAILPVAAAWEMIHLAMLMHDDIIDRDYVRHGKPNVAGSYLEHYAPIDNEANRTHFANSSALLAGDLLIAAAYRLLLQSNFLPSQKQQACEQLHQAIFKVSGGELLDIEASVIGAAIDPLLIAETKTASYSLVGPLLTGAQLAGINSGQEARLRDLGMVLGVGYQFVDDVLGVFGDESVTGKSALSDLEEGKRSFVVVEALKLMTAEQRTQAEGWLKKPSHQHALQLREMLDTTDIRTVLTAKITGFQDAAKALVAELGLAPAHRAVFERLIGILLDRQA